MKMLLKLITYTIAGALLIILLAFAGTTAEAPTAAYSLSQSPITRSPTPTTERVAAAPTATPTPAAVANHSADTAARQQPNDARIERTPPPLPLRYRFEPLDTDRVTRINRGVYHIQRVTNDPLRINILLFDLTAPEFDLRTGLGDGWLSGRTRTSYLVIQNDALAGINGDLFAGQGVPQGLTIVDSRVAMPPKHRATFAWSHDREPFIGYFTEGWTWDAELVAVNGERVLLNEYNQLCQMDHVCLHNEFSRFVAADWRDIKILLSPSGRVLEIVEGEAMRVSPGMRVVQGLGEGAEWLLENVELGDTLTVDIETLRPLDNVAQSISGGPIILQDGRFVQDCLCKLYDCSEVVLYDEEAPEEDMLCEDFSTDWKVRHYEWVYMPRTAVGYDRYKQTLIVIVVDGYQLGYSRGILQEELVDLFLEFGAYEAMELDGGGSTTMVLDGEIVNNPSDDTGERHVANALLFFWDEYTPEPQYPVGAQPPAWHTPAQLPR